MTRLTRRGLLRAAGVAGAAAMAPGVASCASSSGNKNSISVLTLQDPFFYAVQTLLPEFEKQSGISVRFEGIDYDTLNSRATNSFMSKLSDIDVISPDSMWLSRFANNDWLQPLDGLIRRDAAEVDIADFIPSALHSLSEWAGHLYTLPVATYGTGVLYRPGVFDHFGLDVPPAEPSDTWTWDAYLAAIKKITGRTYRGRKMHGTDVLGAGPQPITHMWSQVAASMGARWVTAFPDADPWDFTPAFTTPEMIKSLGFYSSLYRNSPPEAINNIWFDAGVQFGAGGVGMMYHWTPYAYLIQRTEYMGAKRSSIGDDFAMAALPRQPGAEQVINIGGYAFGIGANSVKSEAAWTFIKWVTSAQTQRKMALLTTRQFADFGRRSLYGDDELVDAYPWLDAQLKVIEQGDGKAVRPPTQNYAELEQAIGTDLNRMLAARVPAEQIGASINRSLTQIMEDELFIPWKGESYNDTLESTTRLIESLAP